jgi:hypothetical protein
MYFSSHSVSRFLELLDQGASPERDARRQLYLWVDWREL